MLAATGQRLCGHNMIKFVFSPCFNIVHGNFLWYLSKWAEAKQQQRKFVYYVLWPLVIFIFEILLKLYVFQAVMRIVLFYDFFSKTRACLAMNLLFWVFHGLILRLLAYVELFSTVYFIVCLSYNIARCIYHIWNRATCTHWQTKTKIMREWLNLVICEWCHCQSSSKLF